jgi:hypothetical protein
MLTSRCKVFSLSDIHLPVLFSNPKFIASKNNTLFANYFIYLSDINFICLSLWFHLNFKRPRDLVLSLFNFQMRFIPIYISSKFHSCYTQRSPSYTLFANYFIYMSNNFFSSFCAIPFQLSMMDPMMDSRWRRWRGCCCGNFRPCRKCIDVRRRTSVRGRTRNCIPCMTCTWCSQRRWNWWQRYPDPWSSAPKV